MRGRVERLCADCRQPFVRHARCTRCEPCQVEHNRAEQAKRDAKRRRRSPLQSRTGGAIIEQRQRHKYRVPFRDDFLRALPEMRAELERSMALFTSPLVLPSDPLFLPSVRERTQR